MIKCICCITLSTTSTCGFIAVSLNSGRDTAVASTVLGFFVCDHVCRAAATCSLEDAHLPKK